jgi:thioredoxin reductase (NADPH)
MSRYLWDRIAARPGITIRSHSAITGLYGEDRLASVSIQNLTTTMSERLPATAVFVMIGTEPHTKWLGGSLVLDNDGYIMTGPALGRVARRQRPWVALDRDPYLLETSVPGIFAAGDARSRSVKRAASAVGEGSIAARFVSEYLGTRPGLTAIPVH